MASSKKVTQDEANAVFLEFVPYIKEIGLSFSNKVIWETLMANNFEKERTVDALLKLPQEKQGSSDQSQRPQSDKNL
jgi:hypothetical protein